MAQEFYTILTNAGLAYEAQCKANQVPIKLTHMAVGDGNGAVYNPGPDATALRRETHRQAINALLQDEDNPTWLNAEAFLPPEVGGWTIREVGIFTDTGILYSIGKYPESVKPILDSGSSKQFYVTAIFQTSNAAIVNLVVDNTVVMASRAFVLDHVKAELAKLDAKNSVKVATTANLGALSGLLTIDGVVLAAGDRALVKDQADAKTNGIYVVAAGAWSRAQDADASIEVTPGLLVTVEQGAANGDSLWQLVTDGPISLGTTPLTFEIASGPSGVVAGTYRSVSVDKRGRVTGGSNPTTLAGYGIADAVALGQAGVASAAAPATNIDTLVINGVFIVTASTLGTPPAVGMIGTVQHYERGSSGGRHQLFMDSFGNVYKRSQWSGSAWSTWTVLVTGDDEATQPEAEAGTATKRWMSPLRVFQALRSAAANATEALRGVLRIATQDEVESGTLDNVAVTPKKLLSGADVLVAQNGYISLPKWLKGWTLQWGLTSVTVASNGGEATVSLPKAFPSNHFGGFCIFVSAVRINGAFVPFYSPASLATAVLVLDVVDTTHVTGAKSVFYISLGN